MLASQTGTLYTLEAPFLPWIWAAMEIAGIAIQLAGFWLKKSWFLGAGTLAVMIGGLPERDITLMVGDGCIALALLYILKSG